jgi:hypothetical protein
MKKFAKILFLSAFLVCTALGFSFAQETEDTATEAEMYFASGSVAEASAAKIVIFEYDFDAGQETKVSYEINAQTQFEGAAGALEIKVGDDVEIEYQSVGDKKIATRIEKYAAEDMGTEDEAVAPVEEIKKSETKNDLMEKKLEKENEATETNF